MKVVFPSSTPRQFAIVRGLQSGPAEGFSQARPWAIRSFDDVKLFSDEDLPVIHCRFADGTTAGFMLGEPVDILNLRPIEGELTFQKSIDPQTSVDEWVEDQIYQYAGRFVFVLVAAGLRRIYLDAAGSLAVVYDHERRIAGSTAASLLEPAEFVDRFDGDLFRSMKILNGGWIPAGLTAHRGIKRLLCNFYLDLDDWSVHRHWPTKQFDVAPDPARCALSIGEIIRRTIAAYCAGGSVCMALTGGYETRLLLSLTKKLERPIDFVCFYSKRSDRDLILSQRLARSFGLRFRTLKFPAVSCEEANEWMARAGYCIGENRHTFAVTRELADFDYFGGGVAGEVGRGFFWRPTDGRTALSAEAVYKRLGLAPCKIVEEAVGSWFATLPFDDPLLVLDLAYLELRVCCWASVQAYSAVGPRHVYPMVSRAAFSGMLSLPPSWRRDDNWLRLVINESWPELLTVPVNNLGPVREAVRSAIRVARNPSLIVRRWRKRFA